MIKPKKCPDCKTYLVETTHDAALDEYGRRFHCNDCNKNYTMGVTMQLHIRPCNYCDDLSSGRFYIWKRYVYFCEKHRYLAEREMRMYEDDKAMELVNEKNS